MDSPSTFSEEIQRAKWVARLPPISAMMAASRRGIRRSVFSRRRTPLRTKIVAPMINVAMARRYRAIVMGGEVLHVMKIEANDTETTARAIAAYGPPRIDSGPDRRYLTPVARSPQAPCSPQPAQGLSPFRPYRAIEGIHAAERHREDGDQEGTLRGTGSPLPALGRVRLEHVIAEHHGDGDRDETGGPHRRHALLQPRAGHEARRGDPRLRDVRRDHAADPGPMREAREGGRRSERVARVRREPAPRADDERGVQPPPGRRREPGGHRQGDEARHEHADGAVRTRGLHGPRHRPGRDGSPLPRDRRPEVPSVDAPPKIRSGGAAREEVRPRGVQLPGNVAHRARFGGRGGVRRERRLGASDYGGGGPSGPIGSCGGICGGEGGIARVGGLRLRTANTPTIATRITTKRTSQIHTGRPNKIDVKKLPPPW